MPGPRDPADLLVAARLYYLERRSQHEVAAAMGTSRSNVSRMLAAALEQGIVEFRVHDPAGRATELEQRLEQEFGLREARVASRPATGGPLATEQRVGVLASQLLLESLGDGKTVALSWGRALQLMVWATTTDREHAVRFVQLVGGLSSIADEVSGQELVRELAIRTGASYRYLHAPAVLESRASRDAMLAERAVAQALEAAWAADVAFVGVGTPAHGSSAAVVSALNLSPEDEKAFWEAQPVGDIAARYFDITGREIRGAVHDRVLAVTLEHLVRIPTVVGVASGRVKAQGVLGALRGRLVDVLVCDEGLARAVLAEAGRHP